MARQLLHPTVTGRTTRKDLRQLHELHAQLLVLLIQYESCDVFSQVQEVAFVHSRHDVSPAESSSLQHGGTGSGVVAAAAVIVLAATVMVVIGKTGGGGGGGGTMGY